MNKRNLADLVIRQSEFKGEIGVAKADITPPVGIYSRSWGSAKHDSAEGIHRPLYVTSMFLRGGDPGIELYLVCFDLGSLTLRAIRGHGAFAVNVLSAPQQQLSANFARRGLAAAWDGVRHRPGSTGSPRLDGVLAVLECTVENSLPGGDHEIVVGRVHDVEVAYGEAAPLLYWRGSYLPAASDQR